MLMPKSAGEIGQVREPSLRVSVCAGSCCKAAVASFIVLLPTEILAIDTPAGMRVGETAISSSRPKPAITNRIVKAAAAPPISQSVRLLRRDFSRRGGYWG